MAELADACEVVDTCFPVVDDLAHVQVAVNGASWTGAAKTRAEPRVRHVDKVEVHMSSWDWTYPMLLSTDML